MTTTQTMKRTLVLLAAMVALLIAASGAALAVNKVCPAGSTQANPCLGTTGIDLLIGTFGADYIKGLAGNDKISGYAGADTTDGGGGSDTYSYKEGWGIDTLIDSGGTDALNFSALATDEYNGVIANLRPEYGDTFVNGPNGERINLSSGTVVEKVTGSSKHDGIWTGGAANTLRPGPGTGGADLTDQGGCTTASSNCPTPIPASNDTYSGFAASGYGIAVIRDYGGTADRLVLPFASTDVYFQASDNDGDGTADLLIMYTSSTDAVVIYGQLEPHNAQKGHIETIEFTDGTMSIGSESSTQTLSGATTESAERQVAELNEDSDLDAAEKEKLSKAAKKVLKEAK